MLGLTILLVAGATVSHAFAPPYVQSKEAFAHVRTYVSELLTPHECDIHVPEDREHSSFAILAGVIAGLVTANKTSPLFDPLLVVDKTVPYAWRNYNEISEKGQMFLNEASAKINLMQDLIDNVCDAESITQCNHKVHAKVLRNPYAYKLPAELLLLLGKFSESTRQLEPTINSIVKGRTEIPYLINNVGTPHLKEYVAELESIYRKMRELQFRRSNPHFDLI